MAQLKEDKKREILDFLEERAGEDRLLPLEVERITERFSDETFDEDAVVDIVEELEEDGLLVKKRAKMELVYPSGYEESIEEKFSHLFVSTSISIFGIFFVGTALYFLLLEWQPFFEFVYDASLEPQGVVSRYTLYGIIGAYITGKATISVYSKAQENIEVLRDYRALINPTLVIASVSGAAVLLFTNYTDQSLMTNHIIGIITVSVLGGIAIGKLFFEDSVSVD